MLSIFAHGSLMFRPDLPGARMVPGAVAGWSRRFGQPSVRNWGGEPAPAPTSSLVPGEGVHGLLVQVADPDGALLGRLGRREAQDPIEVAVDVGSSVRPALTWPMASTWAGLDVEDLVAAALVNVDHGGGPFGDAFDYVDGMVSAMDVHGLDDPFVRRYHAALTTALRSR